MKKRFSQKPFTDKQVRRDLAGAHLMIVLLSTSLILVLLGGKVTFDSSLITLIVTACVLLGIVMLLSAITVFALWLSRPKKRT